MKTMPLRVAQHNANAMAVAQFLEGHPGIERVYYPGLAVASRSRDRGEADERLRRRGDDRRQGRARTAPIRVFDRLDVIKRAASLGGVESICSLPILTSQYGLTDEELVKAGVSKGMIRMSIGLEDCGRLDRRP